MAQWYSILTSIPVQETTRFIGQRFCCHASLQLPQQRRHYTDIPVQRAAFYYIFLRETESNDKGDLLRSYYAHSTELPKCEKGNESMLENTQNCRLKDKMSQVVNPFHKGAKHQMGPAERKNS